MDYLITFLEGIITFISPCLLPMLPIYISYFAGESTANNAANNAASVGIASKKTVVLNAFGFVSGFTSFFMLLGAFAGTIGSFMKEYKTAVNIICGLIVILLGLNFMGLIRIPFLETNRRINLKTNKIGFLSAVIFGVVFSIGWTPCVGAFLGSALMMAASGSESLKGLLLLLSYSLGLGIPFIISAVLINQLKESFNFIKKNYRIVNIVSGVLLIVVGLMTATGLMGYFLSVLTL